MKTQKTVSVKEVAKESGVSPSTASIVLNNKSAEFRIAPETRDKVLETAKRLGYRPSRRMKRSDTACPRALWCIFAPTNFDTGPTALFFQGVQHYLDQSGLAIEIILFPFERGQLHLKRQWISSHFVRGAIMTALSDEDVAFVQDMEFDIPIVLFNRTARHCYSVTTDEYTAGQHAMEHFIRRGHERFALISPNYSNRSLSLRSVGFQDAFQKHAFHQSSAAILPTAFGENSYEGGYAAVSALLSQEKRPTALFVLNDHMVGGALHCLQQRGLSIPEDMEIITYGNTAINTLLLPTITSFAVPTEVMSFHCAKILHDAQENGVLTDNVNRSFDAELIFRQSCPAAESASY